MVSGALVQRIDAFIERMGEPYKKVEDVPGSEVEGIHDRYVSIVLKLDDEERIAVLDLLEKSYQANDVEVRLVVGHEDIGAMGLEFFETVNFDLAPRGANDGAGPSPGDGAVGGPLPGNGKQHR